MTNTTDKAKRFFGKTALVTGGASGIGWATACSLAADGAEVAICNRAGESLDKAMSLARDSNLPNLSFFEADVSSETEMQAMFEKLSSKFQKLNFLVNNAGIDSFCRPDSFSLEKFNNVMAINVASVFLAISQALPLMRNADRASIVNVGSIHGRVTTSGRADYATSKTALIGATRALALDLAEYGIRINLVSPGAIETPMLLRGWAAKAPHLDLDAIRKRFDAQHPCGRIGQPDDVASAIKFFLSEESSFINGTELLVDGGIHAKIALSNIFDS